MSGRILVTGASGFVGHAVVPELLSRGYHVNALVNRQKLDVQHERLHPIDGDLFEPAILREALKDCLGVIHLVGIIAERPEQLVTFERIHVQGTRAIVDAAKSAGVHRYIHMSALGTRPGAASQYHRSKHQAEEYVRASGLDWTIIRPSLIHGPAGQFMKMEAKLARGKMPPFVCMPYFGAGPFGHSGGGRVQPIFVSDVAGVFVDALEKPRTAGEIYLLGGPDKLTWPELHRACARAIVGKERPVCAMPAWKGKLLARTLGSLVPFTIDQVIMALEDNTCDIDKFIHDFAFTPAAFEETLKQYAANL